MKKRCMAFLLVLALLLTSGLGSFSVYAAPEAAASEENFEYTLKAEDILIRDPYVVVYEGKYYMYGTDGTNAFGGQMDSFPVWVSEDLENWTEQYTIFKNDGTFWADKRYWAPEVYYIDGEFYLYGSMGGSTRATNGIQLFKSEDPLGPFEPTTEYPFTPEEDSDIDATLYEEDGILYMVYSQGSDGIYAVKLNETLDGFAEEQFKLFNVADASWPTPMFGNNVLNDGACFYKTSSGKLICMFSSMSADGYAMGIAYSDNGRLDGNWTVTDDKIDVGTDGGHCMLFEDLEGELRFCFHAPNSNSHPVFRYLIEDKENDTIYVSETPEAKSEYPLKAEDIRIRDPYIVPFEGKYYMYGTDGTNAFGGQMDSFPVWVSEDLENWSEMKTIYKNDGTFWADKQYWAPEVYYIDGEFYLYGSMGGSSRDNKGIQLFKSEDPLGPFEPTTEYPFTPEEDDDIDATLWEEDGYTFMVYSQGADGMYAVKLNETLDGFADEPFKLYNVADASWTIAAFGGMTLNDGACFYKTASGKLLCFFSSMSEDGYAMGIAYSDNGRLDGNWTVTDDRIDVGTDGGHCMLFEDFEGNLRFCYHAPNGASHPVVDYLIEDTANDTVYVSKLPYVDVTVEDWFYDAVYYNYIAGTMTGMDNSHFGPYGSLSRAQFALMLYRIEGEPTVNGANPFKDIAGDEWYADAVLWAQANGIVTGYEDGNFGPADLITREQMAVMMYRYGDYLGDVAAEGDYSAYKDAASVSEFAVDAMKWAVGSGIITGKDNGTVIDPQGNTARSEAAIIIQRFMAE